MCLSEQLLQGGVIPSPPLASVNIPFRPFNPFGGDTVNVSMSQTVLDEGFFIFQPRMCGFIHK